MWCGRSFLGGTLLPAIAFALLAPASAHGQHFPADEDLALMLRYLVEDGETPGAVLGVLEADGSTRIVSYGTAGPDARPLGSRSVFEIGSITKTFTATLLADMVLKGEVALEDPIADYLPDHVSVPSRGEREITLLDLATHRSGLPTVPDDFESPGRDQPAVTYTVDDAYAYLSRHELRQVPGTRRQYSNFGYGLLGHVLGRAAGTSYQDLVRSRILEPLGMDGSGFAPQGQIADWMVRGHRSGQPVRQRSDMEIFEGAGALRSNAEDLLTYMEAQIEPPETDLEQAMRMAHEIRVHAGEGAGQGLAWSTMIYPGEAPVIGHGGGTVGFRARFQFQPEAGIGTVLLTNDAFFEDDIAVALLYPDPPPDEWEPVPVAPEILSGYAGEYERATDEGTYYIRLEDDGFLTYQPSGKVRARLYATSDSTFYLLRAPFSFTFRAADDGGVDMIMRVDEREPGQQDVRIEAPRISNEAPPPKAAAGNAGFQGMAGTGTWALIALGGVLAGALGVRSFWSKRRET